MSLPPTFIITMPERAERAKQHFDQILGANNYHLFPAFHAKNMKLPKCGEPYLDDWGPNHWAPPYGTGTEAPFYCGPGIHALALGWYSVVKFGLAMRYPYILIMEDDAILCDDFITRYDAYKSELPSDYDMIHWGHCCLNPGTIKQYSQHFIHADVLCTQAVELSSKAMQMINEKAESRTPIDIFFYKQIVPFINHFIAYPQLVDQESLHGNLPTLLS